MEKKLLLLFLIGLFVFASCSMEETMMHEQRENEHPDLSESELMMVLHCQEMQMPGCEEFADIVLTQEQLSIACSRMPSMQSCQNLDENSKVNINIEGLSYANKSQKIELKNQESFSLSAEIVKKNINGKDIPMMGYNSEIPGPQLIVEQGSEVHINFTNNLDMPTTVHWHGLRLKNEFDGVPKLTQDEVLPGESFNYTLTFQDEGVYWYHPHVREDLQQEMGLYGTIIVRPKNINYYNSVHSEENILLDDISLTKEGLSPFYLNSITHALMGRFGTTQLLNGEVNPTFSAKKGEIKRLFLTNVANVRTYNFSISGVQLKLVGGDLGAYEREEFVDSVLISPAERIILEVYFPKEGEVEIKHISPLATYTLGKIEVTEEEVETDLSAEFLSLREQEYVKESIDSMRMYFDKELDEEILLDVEMKGMDHSMMNMKNENHEGIEWEDTMSMMNTMTNESVTWVLRDKKTGLENMQINYTYKVGDKVKIRLTNNPNSMHPMQHPIHFHGQRFLVLEKDGVKNQNFVWKDTVLVPIGSSVDILLDITNPGDWMAHCHIAEHLQSNMMMSFEVKD